MLDVAVSPPGVASTLFLQMSLTARNPTATPTFSGLKEMPLRDKANWRCRLYSQHVISPPNRRLQASVPQTRARRPKPRGRNPRVLACLLAFTKKNHLQVRTNCTSVGTWKAVLAKQETEGASERAMLLLALRLLVVRRWRKSGRGATT